MSYKWSSNYLFVSFRFVSFHFIDEQGLSDLLMFCTGTSTIPPLGFHNPEKITVSEIDSVLPNVNTCPMIIELPSRVSSFEQFRNAMETAISCQSHGFGIL